MKNQNAKTIPQNAKNNKSMKREKITIILFGRIGKR